LARKASKARFKTCGIVRAGLICMGRSLRFYVR
jgi:hypothetical protein